MGVGASILSASEMSVERIIYVNGQVTDIIYDDPEYRTNYGFNFIIEYSYLLTQKILAGFKLYLSEYRFGDGSDRIIGAMLKIGYKL